MRQSFHTLAAFVLGLLIAMQQSIAARIKVLEARNAGLSIGTKCSTSAQCASGYCGHAHCANKHRNGHTCYKDAGCLSGSCYNRSVCYTPGEGTLAFGAKCSTSASCASDNCSRAHCDDKQAVGAACYKAANCLSNTCDRGICATAVSPTSTSSTSMSSLSPTSTSSTSASKSSSASTTTSSGASSTISCTVDSDHKNRKLTNVYSFDYEEGGSKGFPNPYETFPSEKSLLAATSYKSSPLLVTLYQCTSKYMGYISNTTFDGVRDYAYGQIRVPSLGNDCITASSPGASTTSFTHAACSTADDNSQIAQWFHFDYGDQGVRLDYLGDTFQNTKSETGKDYGPQDTNGYNAGDVLVVQDDEYDREEQVGVGTLYLF